MKLNRGMATAVVLAFLALIAYVVYESRDPGPTTPPANESAASGPERAAPPATATLAPEIDLARGPSDAVAHETVRRPKLVRRTAGPEGATDVGMPGAKPGGAIRRAGPNVHFPGMDVGAPTDDPLAETTGVRGRVVDSSGKPIASVKVMGLGSHGGMVLMGPVGDVDVPGAPRAATDARGEYVLMGLSASRAYSLRFAPPDAFLPGSRPAPALRPGEVVDAGTMTLERPGAIEGVVLADGAPVAGATVRLGDPLPDGVFVFESSGEGGAGGMMVSRAVVRTDDGEERPDDGEEGPGDEEDEAEAGGPEVPAALRAGTTKSDAQGRFRLERVRPGTHRVSARARGYQDAIVGPVAVSEGRTAGPVEMRLEPVLTLEVFVRDAHGQPIAGARVHAGASRIEMAMAFGGPMGERAPGPETDASGRVEVKELKSRALTLAVQASGFVRHEEALTLAGPGPYRHEVVLVPGATLSGRVVDGAGEPLFGASARLSRDGEGQRGPHDIGGPGSMRITRRDGAFAFDGLEPGVYRLEVGHGTYADRTVGPFVLAAAEAKDLGDIALDLGASAVVTVLDDESGEPIEGALVEVDRGARGNYVMAIEEKESEGQSISVVIGGSQAARTDAAGVARLTGLDADKDVPLAARMDGFAPGYATVRAASGETAAATITLSRGGSIEGTARRADGTPWAQATVLLLKDGSPMPASHTVSDGSGLFQLARLAPGVYRLKLGEAGAPLSPEVTVVEGTTVTQDVVGPRSVRLAVTVMAGGAPAAGWKVRAGLARPEMASAWDGLAAVASGVLDAAGRAELTVPAVALVIEAEAAPGEAKRFPLDLTSAPDALERTFSTTHMGDGALEGAVLGSGGGPLAGATILVSSLDGAAGDAVVRRSVRSDAEGRFSFLDLVEGAYRVEVTLPGRALEVRDVRVPTSAPLEVTLFAQGYLAARVDTGDGSEAAVRVEARIAGDPEATRARTGAPGEVLTFENLRAGVSYSLVATASGYQEARVDAVATATVPTPIVVRLTR